MSIETGMSSSILNRGFTLLEGVLAMSLMLVILSGVWYLFGSSSRQSASGAEMQEKFHRLRIVTEILKDDLREGQEIVLPQPGQKGNRLEFYKFGSLVSEDSSEVVAQLKIVEYEFDPNTGILLGTYGKDQVPLMNTELFENVEFEHMELMGRSFIRMYFTLKKDSQEDAKELVMIHTVSPRALSSRASKPGWYALKQSLPVKE
ncbi:MAG: hypothetical protein H3C47_12170 [Candidatus Cloacimonetes bacterium]|nr:hypothetical protein [Candidatus Cloacimonadota bacterium]